MASATEPPARINAWATFIAPFHAVPIICGNGFAPRPASTSVRRPSSFSAVVSAFLRYLPSAFSFATSAASRIIRLSPAACPTGSLPMPRALSIIFLETTAGSTTPVPDSSCSAILAAVLRRICSVRMSSTDLSGVDSTGASTTGCSNAGSTRLEIICSAVFSGVAGSSTEIAV